MPTIQIQSPRLLSSSDVEIEIDNSAQNHQVISDAAAKTIAAGWHSPGTEGQHFSRLSHGMEFQTADLLTDIDKALNWTDPIDQPVAVLELWALRAWAAHWTGDYRS